MSDQNLQDEMKLLQKRRRDLHQIPELELNLPETAAYIKSQLPKNAQIIELEDCGSSFAVYFDFNKEQTIAFRSDMDALSVHETNAADYASRHEGCMHACGHDGHMSILMGLADRLSNRKEEQAEMPFNTLLVFQAGEESPGGARLIVESGLFERFHVRAIFGLHLWPMLPKGTLALRPQEMMARSSEINIDITGRSAHAARYKEGIDAMSAGMKMVEKAYEMEASIHPSVYRLLRFGRMEAGTVRNAVASSCRIEGTIRSFLNNNFEDMQNRLRQIADEIEKETRTRIAISYSNGYPAVLNDPGLSNVMLKKLPVLRLKDPEMISEDFSFYQQAVPGVFFFLGTGTGISLHSSNFDFEEDLLIKGVDLFEQIATMRELEKIPSNYVIR